MPKKRKRNASGGSSSKRPCFYLVQDDEKFLESGTERQMQDLKESYGSYEMNVAVLNEQQYQTWIDRCITSKQDEEYREALRRDAEKEAEKQRYEQLQRDFSDRKKRCEIISKSYEELFQKYKYI